MRIQFLGHAAFYLEGGGIKALIDPFIPNELENYAFRREEITHIFVTHGHGDHLGATVEIAKVSNATVITNFELALYLEGEGVNCHSMHIGGRWNFDFGRVKMTPALHGSAIETKDGLVYGGNPCGFVIEVGGQKLYHAGDTGLTMDMKLLAREELDVALLPIGGNYTMDVEDALIAIDFIKPKLTIPMHYNTFPVIAADPSLLGKGAGSYNVKVLEVGEIFEF